jgi:hypothetical protein
MRADTARHGTRATDQCREGGAPFPEMQRFANTRRGKHMSHPRLFTRTLGQQSPGAEELHTITMSICSSSTRTRNGMCRSYLPKRF